MKGYVPVMCAISSALFFSCCKKKNEDEEVISQRFIHKYGYDVPQSEWLEEEYPGKVVTTQRNGVTTVATYDGGILHGPTTTTHPYSQTVKTRQLFDKGILTKQVFYDVRGIPQREESYTSPTHMKVTAWYANGTPRFQEEYVSNRLTSGEYFTLSNEIESRITDGSGIRTIRGLEGQLEARESYENAELAHKESFHGNNTPHISVSYINGVEHGEKSEFGENGAPLYREQYTHGKLDGIATYFQNGTKYLEVPFIEGVKHGIERRFIDGETVAQETEWFEGKRHGVSIAYCDGLSRTEWFYNDEKVNKSKYNELCEREKEIATLQERSKNSTNFAF